MYHINEETRVPTWLIGPRNDDLIINPTTNYLRLVYNWKQVNGVLTMIIVVLYTVIIESTLLVLD